MLPRQRIGITAFLIVFSFYFSSQSIGQQITPTDVYQVVAATNGQLERIAHATFLPVPATKSERLAPRRPRHVFQKARAVFELLQTLRRLNGLPAQSLPPVPSRDLQPADVKRLVDSLQTDTDALASQFALPSSQLTDPGGKKSPTDVYQALNRAEQLLVSLDLPPPLPNDVYRVASTIADIAEEIIRQQGITDIPRTSEVTPGKKPSEVYARGADILTLLDSLNGEGRKINLPAGVIKPNLKTSGISPAVVNDLLGLVVADLIVAKQQLGIETETVFAPPVGGKTPTDVYERLETAHALLSKLN